MITRRSSRKETTAGPGPTKQANTKKCKDDPLPPQNPKTKTKTTRPVKQSNAAQKKKKEAKKQSTVPDDVEESHTPQSEPNEEVGNKRKKAKLVSINFASLSQEDPVFDHLQESVRRYGDNQEADLVKEILDQVALDGLSGITLNRLFLALEAVIPNLKCHTEQSGQIQVWTVIVNQYLRYPEDSGIQAFYIDQKKKHDQKKHTDTVPNSKRNIVIDKPVRLPNQTIQRIPKMETHLHPVQDGFIMGSCNNYLSRVNVTAELINMFEQDGASLSLQRAHDCYGITNIFFVAGQSVRLRILIPDWIDPNINIKLREYCALEMIGKARTLGTVFPKDKALGRYRIMLEAKGLIIQYQPSYNSPIEHHLKRFSLLLPKSIKQDKDAASEAASESNKKLKKLCCDPAKLKVDRSTLTMVYDTIARSPKGLTQYGIRRRLNMPKFHIRNHLKNLLSIKMICSRVAPGIDGQSRVYIAAHRPRRHRRLKGELAKPSGIMASWDETDLRAKKIIGHKRSSFSQAEDSLLILCRITSILIEPNLRLSWCVHKRLVRDLLHQELIESHDKTSDACLRRIKYLKRLPNNIMSINELTADLLDDPDVYRLIESARADKPACSGSASNESSEQKMDKLFTQVLRLVRAKIPNLLGITSDGASLDSGKRYPTSIKAGRSLAQKSNYSQVKLLPIGSHADLESKYQLVDCQSVASIKRAPTYESPKNPVDAKFNSVCLVTMAFTLTSCFERMEMSADKRACQWLLDRFYSSYPDKLISSALSKLNKRSLLTRKCPAEQASLYKPKTKVSLKLNQSVLFLLNRYHANSLIQLAHPIDQSYRIQLSESNEMVSIGLLTSLCSLSAFQLDLGLKIPSNVIAIDQGCDLVVQPSNINFRSDEMELKLDASPLEDFLKMSSAGSGRSGNWLVKCHRQSSASKDEFYEFEARLWKKIDGSVHRPTLFKLLESLLSWIIVFPGIERDLLDREFNHLMPHDHLLELLQLMESLGLITCDQLDLSKRRKPRLFGYEQEVTSEASVSFTYESTAGAYVKFCQLLNLISDDTTASA